MGWFDAVATRYGCRIQGATEAALTVLDVLGYLDEIPVCVGYEIDGEVTKDFPTTCKLEKAKPVFKKLPGWKCDIRGIRKYEDLPEKTAESMWNLLRRKLKLLSPWFPMDLEETRLFTANKKKKRIRGRAKSSAPYSFSCFCDSFITMRKT